MSGHHDWLLVLAVVLATIGIILLIGDEDAKGSNRPLEPTDHEE